MPSSLERPGFPIAPMKGTAGSLPQGGGWVFELKWDGMRVIAHIRGDDVRLQSANGRDVTNSFPELAALAELGRGYDALVLDGEVVAFADGRPSFGALQQRMHVADPTDARRRASEVPVVYVVFDLLRLGEHDTMPLPLHQRRELLERVVDTGSCWRLCEQYDDDPESLVAFVQANQLEGVVAKRRESTYRPGRRSGDWIKIKPRRRQEFVVGGWLSGRGRRGGGLGSLLLGYYDGDDLRYAGSAGSGLTGDSIAEWERLLHRQPECPFTERPTVLLDGRSLHWCRPDQVVEIAYGEWPEGQQLRHPVVLGRRTDKDPREVVREA